MATTMPTSIYHVYAYPTGGDGYDWISWLTAPSATIGGVTNWSVISAWGTDGWDLGDWPYVIVSVARAETNDRWLTCVYVEGDLEIQEFTDQADWYRHLDSIARYSWRNKDWFDPNDSRFYGPSGPKGQAAHRRALGHVCDYCHRTTPPGHLRGCVNF